MAVSELTSIVVPPTYPLQAADEGTIQEIARFLATSLPSDYVDMARCYGTGCFGDTTFYFWIDNPLRPGAVELLQQEMEYWRGLRDGFPEEYEFDIFPAQPGYLPCGGDVDGGMVGWLVDGPPDNWPVVAKSRDGQRLEVHRMPLTSFLARALRRTIRPEIWRPDFPQELGRVTFVPGEQYHQSVAHRV